MRSAFAVGRTGVLVAGLALVPAAPLASQVVYGFVIDSGTTERLVATSLVLSDTLGRPLASGFSGSDGGFAMRAPGPGIYRVRASRLGYETVATDVVDLRAEPSISLLLRLNPSPIALPSLTVVAKRLEARLVAEGFYQRKAMGFGHFLTPEMVARRNPFFVTDLMRNMSGVRVLYRNGRPVGVVLRAGDLLFKGRSCSPTVLVDGLVRSGDLEDLVSADDIAAVEVYPGGVGMPVQVSGMDGFCGAILLWTKR